MRELFRRLLKVLVSNVGRSDSEEAPSPESSVIAMTSSTLVSCTTTSRTSARMNLHCEASTDGRQPRLSPRPVQSGG